MQHLLFSSLALVLSGPGAVLSVSPGGCIYLRVREDHYLRFEVATSAHVVVYDGTRYLRSVEGTHGLVETTVDVPITERVFIPANATEVTSGDRTYAIDPRPEERIVELLLGAQRKVVYREETVSRMVYVPSNAVVPSGASVYHIEPTVTAVWMTTPGFVLHDGAWTCRYVECLPPIYAVRKGPLWHFAEPHRSARPPSRSHSRPRKPATPRRLRFPWRRRK